MRVPPEEEEFSGALVWKGIEGLLCIFAVLGSFVAQAFLMSAIASRTSNLPLVKRLEPDEERRQARLRGPLVMLPAIGMEL